ncbi:MAG: Ger(x)C family spore germination protein [Syntrophomonadaceae bacterium]|nr:Ger(x)C family spore germination protein [Syntrophomonadaceae bacterium]
MLRKPAALLLAASLCFSAGCWDRREVNESFIAIAVGVDSYPGNKLRFTEQIPLPIPKGKGNTTKTEKTVPAGPRFVTVSTVADTFTDGARKAHLTTPRSPLWQHSACYVFGEKFSRRGFSGEVDWLLRNRQIRKIGYMFVARNAAASEVLNVPTEVEKIPAVALVSMIKTQDTNIGIYTPVKLGEFLNKSITAGIEPAVPGVEIVDEGGKKGLKISGTAVFKRAKLVGWLNEKESRGYRWLRPNMITGGTKVIKCPVCGKPVLLETLRSQSKIEAKKRNGEIIMHIKIREEGNFYEQRCRHPLLTPETIPILNREAERLIEEQVRAAVTRAQELDSDIFGFGQAVFSAYPKEWERLAGRWEEVFPTIKVELEVKSEIRRSYLATQTLPFRY